MGIGELAASSHEFLGGVRIQPTAALTHTIRGPHDEPGALAGTCCKNTLNRALCCVAMCGAAHMTHSTEREQATADRCASYS